MSATELGVELIGRNLEAVADSADIVTADLVILAVDVKRKRLFPALYEDNKFP